MYVHISPWALACAVISDLCWHFNSAIFNDSFTLESVNVVALSFILLALRQTIYNKTVWVWMAVVFYRHVTQMKKSWCNSLSITVDAGGNCGEIVAGVWVCWLRWFMVLHASKFLARSNVSVARCPSDSQPTPRRFVLGFGSFVAVH